MTMSDTTTTITPTTETSSIFAEAIGGIATIVLAIVALGGTSAAFLLSIATIVFGAALLIEGTSIASDYAHLPASTTDVGFGFGGLGTVLLAGVAGIILGVLALVGINPPVLTASAVIVFGGAMMLSSSATASLQTLKARTSGNAMLSVLISGTSGAQALAGIAALVLGILAVTGVASQTLPLVALLVLGAVLLTAGNGMNNAAVAAIRSRIAHA